MTSDIDDDPDVINLVSIALDMRERGIEPPIDEICGDRKDLIPAVERALRVVDRMPDMQRAADGFDPLVDRALAGRYRLEQKIGAGSMGFVYRGVDDELGRPVAIKIMRSDLLGGPQAEARFLREAEALAAVQHRSVVSVYDRGQTEDGLMFLVMELVEGTPLNELIHARAESDANASTRGSEWLAEHLDDGAQLEQTYVRQCVRWIEQLAEGLGVAHAAGVIHRDVKPSNILIRRDGTPVMLDFGIAAMDAQQTVSGGDRLVGTPAYMAPERLEHAPVTDAIDVYGLTATLYHALTLHPPYRGTSDEVLAELKRKDPPPAKFYRDDLPRDLEAILDVGLEREVARRYGSVSALRVDLSALLDHRPVMARPVTATERVWRRMKRSREARVLALVAVFGLGWLGVNTWFNVQERARARDWFETWAGVAPTLCLTLPQMREIQDAAVLAIEVDRLDRLVELSKSPIPSRVIRAAFRFDLGDRRGAAEDFRAVADAADTVLARTLATLYAEARDDGEQIPTGDLPPAMNATDRYLAAFHIVRNLLSHPDAFVAAAELLDEEATAESHYAAELRLFVDSGIAGSKQSVEKIEAYHALFADVNRVEATLGDVSTATTALAEGNALLGLDLFADAVDALRNGLALAPAGHSLRLSLSRGLRGIGDEAEAIQELEYAISLRPSSVAAHNAYAKALVESGRYEDALKAVDAAPFGSTPGGHFQRHALRATVHFKQMIMSSPDHEAVTRFATLAAEQYRLANPDRFADRILFCRAMIEGELDRFMAPMFDELAAAPLDWRQLNSVAQLLPDSLGPDQVAALRRYLLSLVQRLSRAKSR